MENKIAHELKHFPGHPYPLGPAVSKNGINFAIAAKVDHLTLCFFTEDNPQDPFAEIELDPIKNKMGNVWYIEIEGLPSNFLYGYKTGDHLLLDPYAKMVYSSSIWNEESNTPYHPIGKFSSNSFDWQGDRFPRIPINELIIYEMHIRGFTFDRTSMVQHKGTFLGVIEKIPYLKELGVNALEIMPICEFNEKDILLVNPKTKKKLCNYFGYSPINYFSPMNRYASSSLQDNVVQEFKTMVRELHKNNIEVILDVVYNHTGEGNHQGPVLSFKGFDPRGYYMLDEQGNYLNFSGCGNTLNTNDPLTIDMILSSLRYWVYEMHVDGFRFDLATILNREENGAPLERSPIVRAISSDPILSQTKLIAEAWDAGGLYQVGGFYPTSRWSEWNGRYRDIVRRFIKGTPHHKKVFATALCGSQDLYGWRGSPACSVNFVTAHDGFSLADLVSYNEKHNYENGENNHDGFNHNDSWNCGVEGNTGNREIIFLRERQIRNFHLALMVSQGIPMIVMGDEYGHSRRGNNNPWCQDNGLNWFSWKRLNERPGLHRFFQSLIHFRKKHPELYQEKFLDEKDITWHGVKPDQPDWDNDDRFIAFTLNAEQNPLLYVAFNTSNHPLTIELPSAGAEQDWYWVVNTHNHPPNDYFEEENREKLTELNFTIPPYSSIMLISASELVLKV